MDFNVYVLEDIINIRFVSNFTDYERSQLKVEIGQDGLEVLQWLFNLFLIGYLVIGLHVISSVHRFAYRKSV
jgi:hypothetical protein